ncbi:Hypothetical protein CAP_3587 [Chondromyces apiculatus DSM 436]|uniref:Cytochrome P460 domain-containing protein n=1 Tax=Chondromyces apiculatus DSM 436 TaxID=1192034 RepID=A0A017T8C1_9BACT|nr:Hypothetical protein CAP_3587 [Chondromyces apiculatus DSM 436]
MHYAAGAPAPTAVLVMEKRAPGYDPEGGDWEYLLVTPAGGIASRGRLLPCQRCHAEALHDHVFGVSR